MKKNSLTTAIVAGVAGLGGLAGLAQAVNLNPDGLGQVLIYPYYTVNGGNVSLISIVNTTDEVKAVKVRFLESLNSREVLDFNLYLSPFDVWTGAVTESADGGAQLTTDDNSCTVPNVQNRQPVPFRTFAFDDAPAGEGDDLGDLGLTRVRQGHVEMIEMGSIPYELDTNAFYPATAATHEDGVPIDCDFLENAWRTGGGWAATGGARNVTTQDEPQIPFDYDRGGLFGGAAIVDVEFGRAATYNADAIDGFFIPLIADDGTGTAEDLHEAPGDVDPSLNDAQTGVDGGGAAIATAYIFDEGEQIEVNFASDTPDAVSAVLMADAIFNEFTVGGITAAQTEWVITFPTKRLHLETDPTDPRPFSDRVDATDDGYLFDTNGSCDAVDFSFFNREEGPDVPVGDIDFSPPDFEAPSVNQLCYEANVLALGQALTATTETSVLGALPSQGARGVGVAEIVSGWARLGFDNPLAAGFQNYLVSEADSVAIVGLPVTGFAVTDHLNGDVGATGVLANYGQIHHHRVSRDGYVLTTVPAAGSPLTAANLGTSWTESQP